MRKINKIIVHCADTYSYMDIGSKEIKRWHTQDRGWSDIGYHFVICRDGTVETGRPVEKPGAHTFGENSNSIGICLVGGKGENGSPEFNFSLRQMKALEHLCWSLCSLHDLKLTDVHGHNEFSSKACPSFNVKEYFKGVKDVRRYQD